MAIEKDMITHYDNIVPMLKQLFYYGSDSLTDMGEKGIAQHSKCSEDIKPIKYIFGDLLEENTNANGNKVYRLRNNHFEDTQRFLMKFFALKRILVQRLCASLFVMQTLSRKSLTFSEIFDRFLFTGCLIDEEGNELINKGTVRRWIKDLAKCGILRKTGKTYTLADRLLCEGELMRTTRENLLLLTDFCSNVLPLAICGGGIRTKLDMKYRSPFLFKHSYPGRIFDDETLWKLLVYIAYRQPISFSYPDNSSVKNYPAPYLPYRIITDKFSGRQYLFLVSLQGKHRVPYLLRIDKMQHLKPAEDQSVTLPDEEELEKIYTDALRFSFSGINISRNRKKPPVTGRLVFRSDAEREVLRRFPEAVITPVDDTHSSTEIRVYNMNEMKPWLRSNLYRIRLTESSDGTAQELQKEWEEWRKMYGFN